MKDITIDNNVFDGCGTNSFWQPACVWFGGYREVGDHNLSFDKSPSKYGQPCCTVEMIVNPLTAT